MADLPRSLLEFGVTFATRRPVRADRSTGADRRALARPPRPSSSPVDDDGLGTRLAAARSQPHARATTFQMLLGWC